MRTAIHSAADWRAPELAASDAWIYRLSPGERAEITVALGHSRSVGRPMLEMTRDDFPLPRLGDSLSAILDETERGRGFKLVRGVPIEGHDEEAVRMIFWGLGLHLGVAMPQSEKAELIGDVRDIGEDARLTRRGYRAQTAISFHTDLSDLVLLLTRRRAKSGGLSCIVSSIAVHNEMLRRRPDLVEVLYQPFLCKKHGAVKPDESPVYAAPVFAMHDGFFASRYLGDSIRLAHRLPGIPALDGAQLEALELLDTIANDPTMHLKMEFEEGDLQFLNNHLAFHGRTEFVDHPEADRKRHLLRMWLATPNSRPLTPGWTDAFGAIAPRTVRGGVRAWSFDDRFAGYYARVARSLGMVA